MDNNNFIITINRECGSGGGEIARKLGEKLGIKVYGRALLEGIAEQFDMTVENIERIKAQKSNWWNDFCRFYQKFGAASYQPGSRIEASPLSIYYAEARILKELAEKESCIILGRAGFNIFRDYPNTLHIFIRANRDARIERIARKQNLGTEEAAKVVDRIDAERDTFVKTVAGTSRYDAHNYDFVINVTGMSTDAVASFLAQNISHKLSL